ncbi:MULTISPECIES: hypothetical protein [Streptomyces]|uniref:hypothetical protein n=1 Tax=Streptomyces TaxID=1883 RepID=UPI001673B89F|nr:MULTISPECIES: hypothetical protein [Streptomyces]MBK3521992.1 hypothetical protein [Streptomyces sp. MBT70]
MDEQPVDDGQHQGDGEDGGHQQADQPVVGALPPPALDAAVHALAQLADSAAAAVGFTNYSDQRLRGRR